MPITVYSMSNQGKELMSYLKDFLKNIANHDYPAFLKLWEEYCSGDELEGPELIEILKAIKSSSFHEFVGKHNRKSSSSLGKNDQS